MKADKLLLKHLGSTLPGKLRLKLYEKITGKKDVLPTKKQGIQLIESLGPSACKSLMVYH